MGNRRRQRQFWTIAGVLALTLPIGLFIGSQNEIPGPDRPPNQMQPMNRNNGSVQAEATDKTHILTRDVALTESLCRLQCRFDLRSLAKRVESHSDPDGVRAAIREMRKEHPHLHAVAWFPPNAANKGGTVTEGEVDSQVQGAPSEWKKAVEAVQQGRRYESKTLKGHNDEPYIVLGEPAKDGGGFVGFIHQEVLNKVSSHQARNLRLLEYPNEDGKYGIRAVDPKTGQEVDVDTPEGNQGISHYKKNEVVVRFRETPSEEQMERMKKEVDAQYVHKLGTSYVFISKSMSTKELLDYFSAHDVAFVEPHYIYVTNESSAPVPNDELYAPYQWNLPIIDTPAGWTLSKGAENVVVAVVDTGVALNHPDLKGHLIDGYNVVDPAASPEDDVGHGTHVAGVISALTDNGQGIAGMTWLNKIMPVKVLDSTGMGSTYAVAEGIIWAADHGAKIINLSLGNYASAQFLHDAIKYAYDRDVVLIAATGNDNTSQPGFPAAYPEVLAVSATNSNGEKASFSNYGDYIDVVAPGENIASTYIGNQYAALSGTSMASPHVTALAALIRSANPALKNTEVYDIIRKSTTDLGDAGKDVYFGYGQINVARALEMATGNAIPEAAADDMQGEPVQEPSFLQSLLRAIFRFP